MYFLCGVWSTRISLLRTILQKYPDIEHAFSGLEGVSFSAGDEKAHYFRMRSPWLGAVSGLF
jgi:hypothetical protein